MRFIFAGGGSGGHIIPALALANKLRKKQHQALFIGNADSIEQKLCDSNGYPFKVIKVQKLYRSFKISNLLFPFYLAGSIIQSVSIMKQEKPDAVVCTGGFVSGPVAIAAIVQRLPLFFHESNSYPGLVTRFLARKINKIYVAFEVSKTYLPGAKVKNLGIPIMLQGLNELSSANEFSLEKVGLKPDLPTILVSGGSQGSLAINSVVAKAAADILSQGFQLIWQTGKTTYNSFAPQFKDTPGIYLFAFSADLPYMLGCSTIAITRAGAMTIAELEETRTPAILIPLPSAAENHQYFNAVEQQKKGVALLLEQKQLNAESLLSAIDTIYKQKESYVARLAQIPHNRAAEQIADDLITTLSCQRQGGGCAR